MGSPDERGDSSDRKWSRSTTIAAWSAIGLTVAAGLFALQDSREEARMASLKDSVILECAKRDEAIKAEYSDDTLAFQTWKLETEKKIRSTRKGLVFLTHVVDTETATVNSSDDSADEKRDTLAARRSQLVNLQCIMAGGEPGFGSCRELVELYQELGLAQSTANQTQQP